MYTFLATLIHLYIYTFNLALALIFKRFDNKLARIFRVDCVPTAHIQSDFQN